MADAPSPLYRLNFPIETKTALKFWSSRFKVNRIKAIIAFSLDLDNANDNLRRFKYYRQYRKRALANFGEYVNNPSMAGIPFSDGTKTWWEEMPYSESGEVEKPLIIVEQPKSVNIKVGDTFTMGIVARGEEPITYQWQELLNGSWRDISRTGESWTSVPAPTAMVRTFRCRVSNSKSSINSNPATVTIT